MSEGKPGSSALAGGKGKARKKAPAAAEEQSNPVHRFVAGLSATYGVQYRTTAQVAEELGVSTNWVRKVQREGSLGVPSARTEFGRLVVYLYTPEDLAKVRRYLAERQAVFANPAAGRADSWEDVVSRRDRSQAEDRP